MKRRIAIVGNGAVGSLIAIEVRKHFPNHEVSLIGPPDRPGSASAAAGAMANVLAEVEFPFDGDSTLTERMVDIGLRARSRWLTFLTDHGALDLVTAKSTIVYLSKRASMFERRNFEYMLDFVIQGQHGRERSPREWDDDLPSLASIASRVVEIEDEFAYDSRLLLDLLDSVARVSGVQFIRDTCVHVDAEKKVLRCGVGEEIHYDRLIVAAGANSSQLLSDLGALPMLQGVGSAFVIRDSSVFAPLRNHVVRTVNRGGAQCGFHTVPRANRELYLGAGNYIVEPGEASHRLETLRYLFSVFETELLDRDQAYELTGQPVLGKRPRGIDGFPLVGCLAAAPDIAVVTGMNRVGLTWAPEFAWEVVRWIRGEDSFDDYFGWRPDRNPLPFGTDEVALEYFVESRLSAALEHGRVSADLDSLERKRQELLMVGKHLQQESKTRVLVPSGYSITPDHWNPLTRMYQPSCER